MLTLFHEVSKRNCEEIQPQKTPQIKNIDIHLYSLFLLLLEIPIVQRLEICRRCTIEISM